MSYILRRSPKVDQEDPGPVDGLIGVTRNVDNTSSAPCGSIARIAARSKPCSSVTILNFECPSVGEKPHRLVDWMEIWRH